jgi:BirA family biotin operon repressor/biotin-[acetyl-CoA-carboxylase] ligase
LKPKVKASKTPQLTFVASLSVAECLEDLFGLTVETKWPNDITIGRRKVCGILGETSSAGEKAASVILGVGVNVNFDTAKIFPESIRATTTSIEKELGRKVEIETVLEALLERLEKTLDLHTNEGFNPVLSKWKKYACFLGKEVEIVDREQKIRGAACDVAEDGTLILTMKDGSLKQIFAGDLSLRIC